MNSQPQTEYQISRDGETIGSFKVEQLSLCVKEGSLIDTDYYWCMGMPEWQPLSELFPSKVGTISGKKQMQWRHVGIVSVMLFCIAGSLGTYIFIHDAPKRAEERYQKALRLWSGEGVPKDAVEAARICLQLAEQDHVGAQFSLGESYQNGDGVSKDVAKAVKWFGKAAEHGDAKAQFKLGLIYYVGDEIPKDVAKALTWFSKAAEFGYAEAQYTLGVICTTGDGVPKDPVKAADWYSKAAAQGYAKAQFNLGLIYARGDGVLNDAAKASEWYQKLRNKGLKRHRTI